jgi:hypothetical protein
MTKSGLAGSRQSEQLQRVGLRDEMRAAIDVKDCAKAENAFDDLETIGIPEEMRPAVSISVGRLGERLDRDGGPRVKLRGGLRQPIATPAAAPTALR